MHEYLPGSTGPAIGMSPDKEAEPSGSHTAWGAGTLPETQRAASPLATCLDRTGQDGLGGGAEDEELTNLNWLHENLLQNIAIPPPLNTPLMEISQSSSSSSSSSSVCSLVGCGETERGEKAAETERYHQRAKPPLSLSLLIYMAIESAPTKLLPVKDIYGWILQHFPYFSNVPPAWKNTVRHTLSFNKCFRKLGKANGNGFLWSVDPEFRPSLMQALRKHHNAHSTHALCTPPASPPSASSSPPRHLLQQTCSLRDSDFDAAAAMMLLKSASAPQPYEEGPIDLSQRGVVFVSRDPKQDHNYSSATPSPHLPGDCSSAPSPRRCGNSRGRRCGKGALWEEPDDLELKEAAGSLLHLAGLRPHIGHAPNRKTRKRKLSRK